MHSCLRNIYGLYSLICLLESVFLHCFKRNGAFCGVLVWVEAVLRAVNGSGKSDVTCPPHPHTEGCPGELLCESNT